MTIYSAYGGLWCAETSQSLQEWNIKLSSNIEQPQSCCSMHLWMDAASLLHLENIINNTFQQLSFQRIKNCHKVIQGRVLSSCLTCLA